MPAEVQPFDTFEAWRSRRKVASSTGTPLKPFVPMAVTFAGWNSWLRRRQKPKVFYTLREYANGLFDHAAHALIETARCRSDLSLIPSQYVLAITEEIGQDRANDISRIVIVREGVHGGQTVRELVVNARIFHEHAVALASAYAVAEKIELVLWETDRRYAWT